MATKTEYTQELDKFRQYLKSGSVENARRALLYPLFQKHFKEKFKIENDAAGADVYIVGQLIVESKTEFKQWLAGLFQALHYHRKHGLAFHTVMVVAREFVGIWKVNKLPEEVVKMSYKADIKKAPNDIGKELAAQCSKELIVQIHEAAFYWLEPKYFLLDDVTSFYFYYVEKRPELKDKEFKFYNSVYQYNDKENRCLLRIPKDASLYIRVGDVYFEKQRVPDHLGNHYDLLDARDKSTISDDFGKDIFKHIQKFKGFVNVPSHVNFQPVIDSFYNKYSPLPHELEEGEYSNSIDFLKHIFGEDKIELDPGVVVERWEMGLDYLTILFRYPTQILPILSLVSEERQTGKTKFLEWLCILFAENAIVIGNQDLENKFNKHWNSKLVIGVDETKIDKLIVLERVKALSTSSFTIGESKGKDQQKVPFFGKFILNSNNVKNFAHIDENEIRFWIIEVPTVKKRNVDLIEDLRLEAGAFLSFLSRREIICQRKERHWFETRLLKTQALQNIIDNSKPTVQKLLKIALAELFNSTEYLVINMPMDAIVKELLKGKYDRTYVQDTLHKMGYKSQKSSRSNYPRMIEKPLEKGGYSQEAVSISFHSTYYSFKKENFIDDEDNETIAVATVQQDDDMPF